MSETLGMTIEIGGEIKESDLEALNAIIDYEGIEVSDGCADVDELKQAIQSGETIKWTGTSSYGECDKLRNWCRKHNLSYKHTCNASSS
jgi:hypothetical protein